MEFYTLDSSCFLSLSTTQSTEKGTNTLEVDSFWLDYSHSSLSEDENNHDISDPSTRGSSDGFTEDLSEPLYDGSPISVLDSYLLLLQYAIRHSLNKKAFAELLQIVGAHIPSRNMISSYRLKKLFTDFFANIQGTTYYCCSDCHEPLDHVMSTCSNGCDGEAADFLIVPLETQLKKRLEGN